MSNIEDIRKPFQDFIAPELRAVIARIDGLEKQLDDHSKSTSQRIDALEKSTGHRLDSMNLRIATLERHTGERFSDLGKRLDADHARTMLAITQLSDYNGLARRVTAIEERGTLPEPRSDH